MNQIITIAVLGGGGRTGNFLVKQLLSQGYNVKLLLRNPENFKLKSQQIEIIRGDALDPEAVNSLVKGCQAVISTVGQRAGEPMVAVQATVNVLKAMEHYAVKRYMLVAGLNIDTPFDKKGQETIKATEWMKANFPVIQSDRQKAYDILSRADADWTLVRVPLIQFTQTRGAIKVDVEDCPGSQISAADIATFLTGQISDTTYIRKSPFIANV